MARRRRQRRRRRHRCLRCALRHRGAARDGPQPVPPFHHRQGEQLDQHEVPRAVPRAQRARRAGPG